MLPSDQPHPRAYRYGSTPGARRDPVAAAITVLRERGFAVLRPAEQRPVRAPDTEGQQRATYAALLATLYRRYLTAAQDTPSDPASLGLTTSELSDLAGVPAPQRRLSELRMCGLVASHRGGQEWIRAGEGTQPEMVCFITSAGVAALRVVAPGVAAELEHPAGTALPPEDRKTGRSGPSLRVVR